MRSARTWARSYCACCVSQPSALPPKTLDNRTAISGEIPRFPFTSSDKCGARDSKGGGGIRDRQAQRLNALSQHKAAGVRWILHRHVQSPSVVIDIVNVRCISVGKVEDHSPVRPNGHRPKAFQLAFERM